MTLRARLSIHADRLLAILLATLLVGATLAFGGAVWWARSAIGLLTFLIGLAWLFRALLERSWRMIRSPLTALGVLGLGLAAVQLIPWPDAVAGVISPQSRSIHLLGVFPDHIVDPSIDLPEPEGTHSPVSVDRSATLRWLGGAAACLALFWVVGQYTNRVGRLSLVLGSVVVAFSLNTTFGVVQLLSQSGGLYGFLQPGDGGPNAPSLDDSLATPNTTVLRLVSASGETHAITGWAIARPGRPFLIGSLMGGPGAYLALGSLGLPLALGLVLQLLAPRGSREGVWVRLGHSGHGSLAVLLVSLLLAGSVLIGLLAGPWLGLPFAIGLLVVGLPCAWPAGLRWSAVMLTAATVAGLGSGVLLGEVWERDGRAGGLLSERDGWASSRRIWSDALPILRDFPVLGSGLGSFAAVYPHYKSHDPSSTTARSSLVQWSVEAGGAGLLILLLAGLWCAVRLPGAIRRVGTADLPLAFALLGTVVCFGLFSVLHWTVELSAVALCACAVGGVWNRWLAGGTDLFV